MGEQTGPRIFHYLWSYVLVSVLSLLIDTTAKKPRKRPKEKTYNSRCSPMVTHLTTNLPVSGLSMGEQTGPRILHYLWSYVLEYTTKINYI
ncbi:hypothetical protein TRIATDRAFT_54178 [Trichoderma atroviride IMI 206040]|uniref:Uncharacterized protein n=1 Tax=Hypocrea atroviridis (strain ATCC 20476 / IMI 206040) TaxID=452589 RepID=G9NKU0_HYPAI|nr:uncharacterized protein TRIATDRAFT_54178 [Trichoderma atroviride IMI 206040]EHK48512.1 hypothetical protein TRIATDRAFT_54178 [Trichoderma atroviride IMI 206040]